MDKKGKTTKNTNKKNSLAIKSSKSDLSWNSIRVPGLIFLNKPLIAPIGDERFVILGGLDFRIRNQNARRSKDEYKLHHGTIVTVVDLSKPQKV